MIRKDFHALCDELGMQPAAGYYFGVAEGWPVRAMLNSFFLQLMLPVSGARDKEKKRALKAALGRKCNVSDGVRGVLTLSLSVRRYEKSAADAVRETLAAVSAAGYEPLDVCPLCGSGGCDSVYLEGSSLRLAHRSCLSKRAYEANQSVRKNKLRGSRLLGTFGALLGMLVGIVPTLLSVLFAEREYALLFAVVPLMAYYGYKLFYGKMDRYALVIAIVMSVLGVYVLAFSFAVVSEMTGSGYPLYAAVIIFAEYASVFDNWLMITRSSAAEFFFAGIGIWLFWRVISDTVEKRAALAEQTVALSQPYSRRDTEE